MGPFSGVPTIEGPFPGPLENLTETSCLRQALRATQKPLKNHPVLHAPLWLSPRPRARPPREWSLPPHAGLSLPRVVVILSSEPLLARPLFLLRHLPSSPQRGAFPLFLTPRGGPYSGNRSEPAGRRASSTRRHDSFFSPPTPPCCGATTSPRRVPPYGVGSPPRWWGDDISLLGPPTSPRRSSPSKSPPPQLPLLAVVYA